jgi:proteasome lid subunit RPN8/RPN11
VAVVPEPAIPAFDVWKMIRPAAMQVMRDHALSSPNAEVGGFMIGECRADLGSTRPRIMEAIPAHAAEGDLSHLTFTHAAWEDLYRVMDRDHPDAEILGWYHSHPGHGIFLSAYDQFIQRGFFPAAWQVAVVIDPLARTEGFFAWVHDEIKLIDEREIGSQGFTPVTAAARAAFRRRVRTPEQPRRRLVVTLEDADGWPGDEATPAAPDSEPEVRITRRAAPVPASVPPPHTERDGNERDRVPSSTEPSEYPLAGHLLPIAAGLVLGVLLALLAGL